MRKTDKELLAEAYASIHRSASRFTAQAIDENMVSIVTVPHLNNSVELTHATLRALRRAGEGDTVLSMDPNEYEILNTGTRSAYSEGWAVWNIRGGHDIVVLVSDNAKLSPQEALEALNTWEADL